MPINAGLEYQKAELKYGEAKTIPEKIKALEEMLKVAPSHKGAEVLRAEIKSKLSKLKEMLEKEKQQKTKGAQISIKKEGAAQVMIVGMTNSGKSLLLSKLTNAKPDVQEYEFTTKDPEIGIMNHDGVLIQLVEMPAIYEDFAYKGRGPLLFSIMRNADLILVVLDTSHNPEKQKEIIFNEFDKAQIRLGKDRPRIKIKKGFEGGVSYVGEELIKADMEDVKKLVFEKHLSNAIIEISEPMTLEELEDALNQSTAYLRCLIVGNKSDLSSNKGDILVSAKDGTGLNELKKKIYEQLDIIKVFTKTPGKKKDHPPIALPKGATIRFLSQIIHKDFYKKFKFARVWGKSVKFDSASVGLGHKLADDDVVEFHLK
ncbi:50S ribosome-binding GTPase [Candidatus Woesearchaeota archaeon]|nr:50S ribosome-binding GTPase [Candidatus Woesearchaeota archaeon]